MDQSNVSAVFEEQPPAPPAQEASPASPPVLLPTEPATHPTKKRVPLLPFIIAVILITASLLLYLRFSQQPSAPATVEASPTPIPNPTQPTRLSAIATTSAFVSFDSALASLSGSINAFTLSDGTLSPPTLDIELGLTP